MTNRRRNVTRSTAEPVAEVPAGKMILGVEDPMFISLVKNPSNQRAFSVVRNAPEPGPNGKPRVTRARRSSPSGVAQIDFPETYDQAKVAEMLKSFGMGNYDVQENAGRFTATRSDLTSTSIPACDEIKLLDDGVIARVERQAPEGEAVEKSQIAVANFIFSSETFSRADAEKWLAENAVDFSEKALDNSTGNFVLQRADVDGSEEVRQVEVSEGVVATVVRSDVYDVPAGFAAVISETAYGNWGWGQLDFAAAMADRTVCELVEDGIYRLKEVLNNIFFYSPLPVDVRKELMRRAVNQFADYTDGMLDLLPRALLVSVANVERSDKEQEQDMSKETKAEAPASEVLTRSDIVGIVNEALAGFAEKITAVRSEPEAPAAGGETTQEPAQAPATEQAPAQAPAEPAAQEPAKQETLTRADVQGIVAEALGPVGALLEKLQHTTVLRSDADDAEVQRLNAQRQAPNAQGDVFKGVLGVNR